MSVYLTKRALPPRYDVPPPEVAADLMRLAAWFGQQTFGAPAVNLNVKKLAHRDGAYRVRTGDWRFVFFRAGDDFLVEAIGPRRDILERLARLSALGRKFPLVEKKS